MNLTKYRKRSGYGQRVRWSQNAVAAKARLRIERAHAEVDAAFGGWKRTPKCREKLPSLPFVTISVQFGSERRAFRVHRYDPKRFIALGKVQAASTIGKRIALAISALL